MGFYEKTDLPNLKSEVDKLDTDKLEKVPSGLNSTKSKLDKLDVYKLVPVSVGFSKMSNVVKNDVVLKDPSNAKIKDIEKAITNITDLATNTTLNAKINQVKNKISNIMNLPTTTALKKITTTIKKSKFSN